MPTDILPGIWRLSEAIRRSAPLVHNITNAVMQNDTTAVISAIGACQVTVHIPDEVPEAAMQVAAMAVNAGTPDAQWVQGARRAVKIAGDRGVPWVFDPVAVGFSTYRTQIVRELMDYGPTVVKANASEILVLAGQVRAGRGADSIHSVDEARDAATDLARRYGCTVAVSGAEDLVTDGRRQARVANGHPLLGQMVGSGCMLTAAVGCYLAVACGGDDGGGAPAGRGAADAADAFTAAVAATARFAIAGEVAAERAVGPGSLKPLFVDALYTFDQDMLRQRLNVAVQ